MSDDAPHKLPTVDESWIATLAVLLDKLELREATIRRSVGYSRNPGLVGRAGAARNDLRPPPWVLRDEGALDQLADITATLRGILERFERESTDDDDGLGPADLEVPPTLAARPHEVLAPPLRLV